MPGEGVGLNWVLRGNTIRSNLIVTRRCFSPCPETVNYVKLYLHTVFDIDRQIKRSGGRTRRLETTI